MGAQLWIILRLQSAWSLLLHAYVRILSIELTEVPNFLPHSQAYTTLALYLDSIHLGVLSGQTYHLCMPKQLIDLCLVTSDSDAGTRTMYTMRTN